MAEYIEREALINEINLQKKASKTSYPKRSFVVGDVLTCIYTAPAADVAPAKRGCWSLRCDSRKDFSTGEYDEDFYLECSECKRKVWDIDQSLAVLGEWGKLVEQYPYCHCGARMDGERKEPNCDK